MILWNINMNYTATPVAHQGAAGWNRKELLSFTGNTATAE